MCRERALADSAREEYWSAQAEQWTQRALEQIAFELSQSSGVDQAAIRAEGEDRVDMLQTSRSSSLLSRTRLGGSM